jgi:periplasmic protein TonB
MRLSTRRTLVQAMIASLLIHAALLLGVVVLSPARLGTTASTINVVVKREDRRIPPEHLDSVPEAKPPVAPVNPRTSLIRKEPKQATKQATIVTGHSVDTFVVPTPASSPIQDVAVGAAVSPVEAVSGVSLPPGATVAASDGISANDLSDLRVSLIMAAKRFKSYPPLAKERGWEGTVDVVLTYRAHSPYPDVSLAHSSGRTILDEQALETVGRASHATALPVGLRGREFPVSLPVKFGLEDAQ